MTVRPQIKTPALRVVIYWIIVLIPLGWGVYQSVINSLPLFDVSADSAGARDSARR